MAFTTLEKLGYIKQAVFNLPIMINTLSIVEEVLEKRDLTPGQADELGKILYGWLPKDWTFKKTATPDEIERLLLAIEAWVDATFELYSAGQACVTLQPDDSIAVEAGA